MSCECCKKNNVSTKLVASNFGPYSLELCDDCSSKGLDSYNSMVLSFAYADMMYEDITGAYKTIVDNNLEFYNVDIDKFNKDIEEEIDMPF